MPNKYTEFKPFLLVGNGCSTSIYQQNINVKRLPDTNSLLLKK